MNSTAMSAVNKDTLTKYRQTWSTERSNIVVPIKVCGLC